MVRDPNIGRYRQTRLFVSTLAAGNPLTSGLPRARICAELHEKPFRLKGGVTCVVVLDNLRVRVLTLDTYGPGLQSAVPRRGAALWRGGSTERTVHLDCSGKKRLLPSDLVG